MTKLYRDLNHPNLTGAGGSKKPIRLAGVLKHYLTEAPEGDFCIAQAEFDWDDQSGITIYFLAVSGQQSQL